MKEQMTLKEAAEYSAWIKGMLAQPSVDDERDANHVIDKESLRVILKLEAKRSNANLEL